jgi:hypothetical protein
MAALNRSRDRGQLILVTGFTIAVLLVALVLLLNTVIYTENLATRGIDSGADDAVEYRATVVGSVGELIEYENERYDERDPPNESVRNGIDTIDENLSDRYLLRGTIAEIGGYEIDVDDGSPRIWQPESEQNGSEQNESGNLTAGGESDWTVATNVTDIERFSITVDSIDNWSNDTDDRRLRIVVDDSESDPWTLQINTTPESQFDVRVNGSNTSTYENAPLEIDLVDGTISDGTTSENITSVPTTADTITYENGNTTTGTFELHVDGTPGGQVTRYGNPSGDTPYYTYPVESVGLTLYYETDTVRFVTEERIDRGGES